MPIVQDLLAMHGCPLDDKCLGTPQRACSLQNMRTIMPKNEVIVGTRPKLLQIGTQCTRPCLPFRAAPTKAGGSRCVAAVARLAQVPAGLPTTLFCAAHGLAPLREGSCGSRLGLDSNEQVSLPALTTSNSTNLLSCWSRARKSRERSRSPCSTGSAGDCCWRERVAASIEQSF